MPRRHCRVQSGRTVERQTGQASAGTAAVQTPAGGSDEMVMSRYIHTIPIPSGGGAAGPQLEELNRVMDYQNKILTELLTAVQDLAGALRSR